MRKITFTLGALALAALVATPAIAATQWNFGAALKYSTFWTQYDAGKERMADRQGGGAFLKNDHMLNWGTQGNSEIRMLMKSDNLEGYIVMEWDFDENKVKTSEYWGRYRFNDKLSLTIGQQHQLFNSFISNQVWFEDLNMNGIGTAYQSPTPKITLAYGGFSFALAKPYDDRTGALNSMSTAREEDLWGRNDKNPRLSTDADTFMPQIQAAYEYMADTWRVKLSGAYQNLKYKKIRLDYNPSSGNSASLNLGNKTVNSWLVALDGDISFGPLYLAAGGAVGQNWADAGWNNGDMGVGNSFGADYFDAFGIQPKLNIGPWGVKEWSHSWENTTSVMASLIAGYRLTEALRFEWGLGYRYDENDAFHKDSHIWNTYLQAAYSVAPGFTITPEVGYIDLNENVWSGKDQGYIWYAGAKWQMDF